MNATNTPRPRRLAGHRPHGLSSSGRPRKIADSRRVAVRSVAARPAITGPVGTETAGGDDAVGTARKAGAPVAAPAGAALGEKSATTGSGLQVGRLPRWRVGRLTVVLLALAVALAAVVGLLGWNLTQVQARAEARKAAQMVAADSMETILSYDYAHYDSGVTAAKTLMTADFAKKYTQTVAAVRPQVMRTQSVVRARVVASSVISADPDRVKALLFVNQTTTGRQVQAPRVDLNRVVVTLVRGDGGAWLVSDVDAL